MKAPILDAHQHFWDPNCDALEWMAPSYESIRRPFGPGDLQPSLGRNGVAATIAVQASAATEESVRLLWHAESTPFICGVVGWVDLTQANVGQQIEQLQGATGGRYLVGIRHDATSEPDPDWLIRPEVSRGLEIVGRAGLTFDLEITAQEMPAACRAVSRHPAVRFVLDHLGKPAVLKGIDPAWVRDIRLIASFPNVFAKVSGLVTGADWAGWTDQDIESHAQVALEAFGWRRLLFGSDWPVCLVAATYDQVARASWIDHVLPSQEATEHVLALNAIDAYALTEVHLAATSGLGGSIERSADR